MEKRQKSRCIKNILSLPYLFNSILVFIYTLTSILTPADSLHIKIISIMLLLIYNFLLIYKKVLKKEYYVICFHVFVFPSILFIFSIISGGVLFDTIANVYPCFLAGLVVVIINKNIDFEKYVIYSLILISILIVGSVLLDAIKLLDIYNNSIMMYLDNNSEAMVGKSPIYWSYYVIFLKASPLILILLGHSLYNRKYILSALSALALLLSGTRANFFATILMITIYVLIIQKKGIYKLLTILLASMIVIIFINNFNNYFTFMFVSKIDSRIDKVSDIEEIFSVFKQHPLTIFIGTGYGTDEIYGITNGTAEISLFDMWRKNGIIALLVFLYFVIKPMQLLWKKRETRWVVYTYISYLMVAMTNPLFFSSTAYIMYIYVYIKYYKVKRQFKLDVIAA